jgi:hypothetical protein
VVRWFHALRICHQISAPGTDAATTTVTGSTIFAFDEFQGKVYYCVEKKKKSQKKKKKKHVCNKTRKTMHHENKNSQRNDVGNKERPLDSPPSVLGPSSGRHDRRASAHSDA